MDKKLVLAIALLSLLLVAACATSQENEINGAEVQDVSMNNEMKEINPDLYCETNDDCVCGRSTETAECGFGNTETIVQDELCLDFCGGPAGKLDAECIENECRQI